MRTLTQIFISLMAVVLISVVCLGCKSKKEQPAVPMMDPPPAQKTIDYLKTETKEQFHDRMDWWRQARFGMFIHWGLYAIPEGQWKDKTTHGEWILTTGQIPVAEYEKFAPQFNPVNFDAAQWVKMAKDAGMKYIVITSKHHDGFCLYDSKATDYDVIDATPFKRDILMELTEECNKQGIRMCFYYSIMDWHHTDYLPRRGWEDRPENGADFQKYIDYMTAQVTELVTKYNPHILWFDGEWEKTWSHDEGVKLYNHIRNLKPDIIINNRIDTGRGGMGGIHDSRKYAGDYGTPEQEIPATGMKGYDWETCMTMNRHWGWNKNDKSFKSSKDLIHKLTDIASKGGNYLLNIGPRPDGTFPAESIDRLADIGRWMNVNSESIYGTSASRFEQLTWGRSTTKDNTIYLHVFDWPKDNKLTLPGLITKATEVYPLANPDRKLTVQYADGGATIQLPIASPDPINTVIALKFKQKPEIVKTPQLTAKAKFYPDCDIEINCGTDRVAIHYTTDASEPTLSSPKYTAPIKLTATTTIKCRVFKNSAPITPIVTKEYTRLTVKEPVTGLSLKPGLKYDIYHGKWKKVPDYKTLTPIKSGIAANIDTSVKDIPELLSIIFNGYITVDKEGLYEFSLDSDDGSNLYIAGDLIVDNDGMHAPTMKTGSAALKAGNHPIRIEFVQGQGGIMLDAYYAPPGQKSQKIPPEILSHQQ